ncbi:spike base protein, RCAP_Rcc01079 family [Brevundimonas balnearis]|uniref:Uncharacterized protein n=1 Tax=Brevundimonas balnearis TaxID=1572858 RepID=A0ABV6R8B3_9CAUL
MKDIYASRAPSPEGPARRASALTPSDTADLPEVAKALFLGQGGDLTIIPAGQAGDTPVSFAAHPSGYVPIQTRRVLQTGTTAGQIVALFD